MAKFLEKVSVLYVAKEFKSVKLSRKIYIWKDDGGTKKPIYLADAKNDTFSLDIGTVSDWKTAEARDLAMQYFVDQFDNFPKSLRAILDKDDPKLTLKAFVAEMVKAGLPGKKYGYPVEGEASKQTKEKAKTAKAPAKTSKISDVLKEDLKKKASKIAREQGVEVLTPEEVNTLEDV